MFPTIINWWDVYFWNGQLFTILLIYCDFVCNAANDLILAIHSKHDFYLWVWFVISLLCHKKVKQLLPLEHPNMIEYFQMCVLSTFCSLQRLDKIASETLTDAEMLWAAHRERKNCWNLHFLSFKCPQLLLCKAGQNLQISEKRPIRAEKVGNTNSLIWFSHLIMWHTLKLSKCVIWKLLW